MATLEWMSVNRFASQRPETSGRFWMDRIILRHLNRLIQDLGLGSDRIAEAAYRVCAIFGPLYG